MRRRQKKPPELKLLLFSILKHYLTKREGERGDSAGANIFVFFFNPLTWSRIRAIFFITIFETELEPGRI